MESIWPIILMTTIAGAAIPAGALLALNQSLFQGWLETEFRHSVIAFGGGALLAAVALVLVPKGIEKLSPLMVVVGIMGGGIAFGILDARLSQAKGSASQLIAMLADFIPEAMALGALLATNGKGAHVLALLIALQNLPEGFNAFRELTAQEQPVHQHRGRRAQSMKYLPVLAVFLCLVPIGPLAGISGHIWLAEHASLLGFIMLVASGGILYLVFQDIAPQAKLERHWAPSLGAVAGFLLGVLGHMAAV